MDLQLLEILACPNCKGRLMYDRLNNQLICRFDRIAFPICNDIPIMALKQARTLSEQEIKESCS